MDEKIVKDSQGLAKELVNGVKEFEELKVIDLNGRPYYSIIYLENGNEFEGYASYNLKVISEYLKRHFGFAQPETHDKRTETHACDLIDRQAAIDIERNATVDTNPSHFEAHQKFTQFMDDAEISSFGRWQWSNGFNTALTAVVIDLKKLPAAQPEQRIPQMRGWVCPVCGRGLSPYTSVCPCNNGKGWEITC